MTLRYALYARYSSDTIPTYQEPSTRSYAQGRPGLIEIRGRNL